MQESRSGKSTREVGVVPILIVFSAAVFVFLGIAFATALSDTVTYFDASVATWLHVRSTPLLTDVMAGVSFLGAPTTLTIVAVVVSLLLLCQRRYAEAAALSTVVVGGNILNFCLKHLIQRGRPVFDDPIFSLPTYSFPSGHAMASTVFFGLLAIYVSVSSRRRYSARAAIGAAVLMIALVCFSRVYLGLHYLSDVMGGTAEGIAWLALSLVALCYIRRERPRARVDR